MASVHTPNPLGAALGLVAVLMVGDVAINVDFFSEQVILFTSVSAIGTFATPSYELSMANQVVRIVLLVLHGWRGVVARVANGHQVAEHALFLAGVAAASSGTSACGHAPTSGLEPAQAVVFACAGQDAAMNRISSNC
jgi:hypothetical protein